MWRVKIIKKEVEYYFYKYIKFILKKKKERSGFGYSSENKEPRTHRDLI